MTLNVLMEAHVSDKQSRARTVLSLFTRALDRQWSTRFRRMIFGENLQNVTSPEAQKSFRKLLGSVIWSEWRVLYAFFFFLADFVRVSGGASTCLNVTGTGVFVE